MRNNIQKKIHVGLMGIVLVLMYSGCAQLNEQIAKMKSPAVQEASSEEAKPTASADRLASVEKKTQSVEKTEPVVQEKARSAEKTEPPIEKKVQAAQSSTPCVHKVRWPGETLSVIAKWYTGDFDNWKALTKANPKLNPNRMFIGTKILIPEDLVKNREPMPQEFLGKFASKGKKK
jgi:hypothetical protein